MIKEISYQIIGEIKDRCKSLDDATLIKIIEKIKGAKSIFFQGLGRSKLSFCFFAMRLMHLGYSCLLYTSHSGGNGCPHY